jgi:hypothetical protein
VNHPHVFQWVKRLSLTQLLVHEIRQITGDWSFSGFLNDAPLTIPAQCSAAKVRYFAQSSELYSTSCDGWSTEPVPLFHENSAAICVKLELLSAALYYAAADKVL